MSLRVQFVQTQGHVDHQSQELQLHLAVGVVLLQTRGQHPLGKRGEVADVAAGDEVPGRKLSRGLLHPEHHVLARYPHQEQLRAEIRLCHHSVNVVPEFEKVLLQFRGMLGLGQLGQGQRERGRLVRVEPGGGGGGPDAALLPGRGHVVDEEVGHDVLGTLLGLVA